MPSATCFGNLSMGPWIGYRAANLRQRASSVKCVIGDGGLVICVVRVRRSTGTRVSRGWPDLLGLSPPPGSMGGAVLGIEEPGDGDKPPAEGLLRSDVFEGAPVTVGGARQKDDATQHGHGSGDEEKPPEALEVEPVGVGGERAALVWAARLVTEPSSLDLGHLLALCYVQDRPRQVRR